MENFYILDIRNLPDPLEDGDILKGLPAQRREKILRYKNTDDKKRSLGAGLLIKRILDEHGSEESLKTDENGKPVADGIYFNISHSGDYVIAVFDTAPIGCDIEKMKKAPVSVIKRCFGDMEAEYIKSHGDTAFWQLWTLKESYVKMTGEGMKLPFKNIEINEDLSLCREGIKQNAAFKSFIYDGYMIGICAKGV